MHRATLFGALAVTLRLGSIGTAALVVNPARPITHQVTIQAIQTALDNGDIAGTVVRRPHARGGHQGHH